MIRISGPDAGATLRALTAKPLPTPRHATRARLTDPATGVTLDDALILWFPAPHSFTGEDVAELQVHGSRAVLAALTATLAARPGLRLAEPGEFTRRAFHEGKLDLAEVEGLADLIAAETEAQRRQALRQLEGELGRRTESWRARLLRALAHAEAEIDFPDEDLPGGLIAALGPDLTALADEIDATLADQRRGERLRAGLSLAIIGPPNAGKSSLLNWLAQREAAIVSATAGTTRDVIELQLDLGGYPVVVADTAGLRELSAAAADDPHTAIEREGIARARARAAAADLKLLVLDASEPADPAMLALVDADTVVVMNKTDLVSEATRRPLTLPPALHAGGPPPSPAEGEGKRSARRFRARPRRPMLPARALKPLSPRGRGRAHARQRVGGEGLREVSAPRIPLSQPPKIHPILHRAQSLQHP